MPVVTNATENKVLEWKKTPLLGKIYKRCKKSDSQMLGTNTSKFASAKSLPTNFYFRGSNWKTELETDNLEEE